MAKNDKISVYFSSRTATWAPDRDNSEICQIRLWISTLAR